MRQRLPPLLLLLLATPAFAEDPPPPAAAESAVSPAPPAAAAEPAVTPAPPPPPPLEARLPKLGLRIGAGFPDGVTADVVYRPLPYLRLQAGPAWNYLAFGLQAGVAVTPFRWAVSPVLEASYGHFFGADLNKVFKNVPTEVQPLMKDFGYDYFNGLVGIEFGSPRGLTFSVGLGLSYLWSDVKGTATVVRNPGTASEATVTVANPSLRAVTPSLRLGLLFYF
jgi:hypothetical protein